jgi:hypothetical protein
MRLINGIADAVRAASRTREIAVMVMDDYGRVVLDNGAMAVSLTPQQARYLAECLVNAAVCAEKYTGENDGIGESRDLDRQSRSGSGSEDAGERQQAGDAVAGGE